MKKIFLIGIVALAVLNSCINNAPANDAPPPPLALPVATIASETTTTDTEYPASIQGAVDVEIRPQVSGNLDRVFIDEGAYVKKGQPLFKINERPFVSNSIRP